jgi:hypothetical protein
MAGLDPAIYQSLRESFVEVDRRVKPGDDETLRLEIPGSR